MADNLWLALVSVLVTILISLVAAGHKDISRRINLLERQDTKMHAALVMLLVAKADDSKALAEALHTLLTSDLGKV